MSKFLKHMKVLNNQQFLLQATAAATPFRLSRDHSLSTDTINYMSSKAIRLPIQWHAQHLPSSMRCPKKQIANQSHQLHLIVSHPPILQRHASWLSFVNSLSNSYYSPDYIISPCLSLTHFQLLQWGFQ